MKKIILILTALLLVLAGCGKSAGDDKEVNIYTGVEGLAAEFAKTAPPQIVYEESSFPVLLRIKNNGAYSIKQDKKGLISIGREKDYIPAINFERNSRVSVKNENQAEFFVDGKTQLNPKGDEFVLTFNAKTGRLEPQSEQKNSLITANLCYPYKTTLSTTICIDSDVIGLKPGAKVCEIKEQAFNNGQGAPIAVTKIETQMIPQSDQNIVKPQFLIFVENKGKGNPVETKSYPSVCGSTDAIQQDNNLKNIWNVAYLKAFIRDNQQLVCCPNAEGKCEESETNPDKLAGFVRFRDNKDFVRCTFRNGISKDSDAFASPLRVEIDYGYVHTITASFIMQKPVRY